MVAHNNKTVLKKLENVLDPVVILLVDDDKDFRTIARDAINTSGVAHHIFEVSNGIEALHYLRQTGGFAMAQRPDVIFLDLEMPGMDGQQLLTEIHRDNDLKDIPVIMMTGVSDENARAKALLSGAARYTVKPNKPEDFLRVIHESVLDCVSMKTQSGHRFERVAV